MGSPPQGNVVNLENSTVMSVTVHMCKYSYTDPLFVQYVITKNYKRGEKLFVSVQNLY